jgi:hypothetical protein
MASKPTDASMPFLNLGKEQTEAMARGHPWKSADPKDAARWSCGGGA